MRARARACVCVCECVRECEDGRAVTRRKKHNKAEERMTHSYHMQPMDTGATKRHSQTKYEAQTSARTSRRAGWW